MNKNQRILIGIALVLLFTGTALAISTNLSASSDVEIYTFDPLHDGHKKLKLEHAKAADGKTISSIRIKAGEIDEHGSLLAYNEK